MGQLETVISKVPYQPELQAEFLVLRAEAETLYCRLKSIQEQQRFEQAEGVFEKGVKAILSDSW